MGRRLRVRRLLAGLVAAAAISAVPSCGFHDGHPHWRPRASDVAVLYAGSYGDDVVGKLTAQGVFASVTMFDLSAGTPTWPELMAYESVLVSTDGSFDAVALGDVLADYVDSGGGVVCAMYVTEPGLTIDGRWDTGDYHVIPEVGTVSGDGPITLGPVLVPDHPIMAGVTSFSGGDSSYRTDSVVVHPSATLVACWSDTRALVGVRTIGRARLVGLGFYPPSSDVRSDFWDPSTDGALLLANSLRWAAGAP